MDVIAGNAREINSLNQRGGRMLTIVDLIEDGTADPETAGYLLACVEAGASFLCAAGPGGVGKSTLMACLLSFLPPGERIITVTDPAAIPEADAPTCYLCHEIGAGSWFGYLWGEQAACFLRLRRAGRVAASLHADSDREIREQLLSPSVGADEADLAAVDLLLTMVRDGGRRRISTVYESSGDGLAQWRPVVEWDPRDDSFTLAPSQLLPRLLGGDVAHAQKRTERATGFILDLLADDVRLLDEVLENVAQFYLGQSRGERQAR